MLEAKIALHLIHLLHEISLRWLIKRIRIAHELKCFEKSDYITWPVEGYCNITVASIYELFFYFTPLLYRSRGTSFSFANWNPAFKKA